MVLGLWFESVRVMFPLFYYFKRASRSHAKTGGFPQENDGFHVSLGVADLAHSQK